MKAEELRDKLTAARGHLAEARAIAEQLRHDARLHELAMLAVFTLEDCVFEFEQTYRLATGQLPQDHV